MKIALVSPYDYPYPGGVQEHIGYLERNLVRLGHEVKIIAPSSSDLSWPNLFKVGYVVPVPANGSVARITLSFRVAGRVRQILDREHFDVVHIHEPLAPALPLTVLRLSQSVNIGTFHRSGGSEYTYYYGRRILRRFFNRLDGRIAVSKPALDLISEYFPARYIVIPNGVDVDRFGTHVAPIPELRDGRPNILFVGRLEKRKGFRHLLEAFPLVRREFPEARLLVVGGYGEKQSRRYQAIVRRHNLGDVYFLGYVPAADLPRYYRSCDVFCAPSVGGESFGIILLEAMASGVPIVASNIDGYRTVLTHGREGLLVPPGDAAALANAIAEILARPRLRAELSEQGRRHAESYAWPKIANQVLGYYQAVRYTCGLGPFPQLSDLELASLAGVLRGSG